MAEVEKETILTPEGLHKLEEELGHLKTVRRKEVAGRIKQSKEFGDLMENSEYEDAKNEQAFVEGRILQLEQMLRNARVVDNHGAEINYMIVGSAEADPDQDKISNESPVGRALLGKRKGDAVEVAVPAGKMRYTILQVKL
ncbi:MAG: transcription elongation factor GreA [Armatimonadetes bacterium 13_1_40CM_3_65_7]|nr:MAG: transcription elongation factor GreA [Armatimonadetes bacterium 13_1_40CM_3_65_7]